jgi:hypothetical protein
VRHIHRPFLWPFRRARFYDSERAEEIHAARRLCPCVPYNGRKHAAVSLSVETLFRTAHGRFFLQIEDDGWFRLIPLSPRRARRWLFQNPPDIAVFQSLHINGRFLIEG